MPAVFERLTLDEFRDKYADENPYWEYWNGTAVRKSLPTRLHAKLQLLLAIMLQEIGYSAYTELTLRIDPAWEPIPDITASALPLDGDYPTHPVDVVAEILSPDDRFIQVIDKCQNYARLGIRDILIFDPLERRAWAWNRATQDVVRLADTYQFLSCPATRLSLAELWTRFR